MTREDLLLRGPVSQREARWGAGEQTLTLERVLEQTTRRHVQDVLLQCDNQKAEAARRLGVDRTTLYRLLRRHDIAH